MHASSSLRQIISCALDFDVDSTSAKISGYFPGLGAVVGIKRIAENFFPQNRGEPLDTTTRVFNVVRGGAELIGAGCFFLPVDFCLFLLKIFIPDEAPSSPEIGQDPIIPNVGPDCEDEEITQQLGVQEVTVPEDRGGNEKRLFLSTAPEITKQDLKTPPFENMSFDVRENLSLIGQEPLMTKPGKDEEIIQQLGEQGFTNPQERGKDGRCLFLSIAPQITKQDLEVLPFEEMEFEDWDKLSLGDKANQLRNWAMENQRTFINTLLPPSNQTYDNLPKLDRQWIQELYKDMIQELFNLGGREFFKKMERENPNEETRFAYVKANFNEYHRRTKRIYNWAGSSEAISLARLLNKELQMFGLDYASSNNINRDDSGKILPYCQYPGKGASIYIFQCNGGNHYQQLSRKSS